MKTWSRPVLTQLIRGGSAETVLQSLDYCKCFSPDPKYGSNSTYTVNSSSVCGLERNTGGCATCYHTGITG